MENLLQKSDFAPDTDANTRPENVNDLIYIGTKIIKAVPMTSDEFKKSKGQEIGLEENAAGYRVQYEDGYVSWSPKNVFERCYRPLSNSEIHLVREFNLLLKSGRRMDFRVCPTVATNGCV